jgi:hypothetical protein
MKAILVVLYLPNVDPVEYRIEDSLIKLLNPIYSKKNDDRNVINEHTAIKLSLDNVSVGKICQYTSIIRTVAIVDNTMAIVASFRAIRQGFVDALNNNDN